jgi:DNA-binding XRE family transcriptional regulator
MSEVVMNKTITLTIEEYEDLVDSREAAIAGARLAAGEAELLTSEQVEDYLAAKTPLAFWRQHRGVTQTDLAAQAGISQPYLAQMEAGTRTGTVDVYARLAKALRTRIDDLVAS